MSSEIESLSQMEGSLVQIDHTHVKSGPKNKPSGKWLSLERKMAPHLFIWGLRDLTVWPKCILASKSIFTLNKL